MSKKNKKNTSEIKTVRSVNKNVRSSTRKLKPILKAIVGKKVGEAIRDLTFSEKEYQRILKKRYHQQLRMLKITFNTILTNYLSRKLFVGNKL